MASQCPHCEGTQFTIDVPSELVSYAEATTLGCCRDCLAVEPSESTDEETTVQFETIHPRFPTGSQGVGVVLLLDLLDLLALNRAEIEALVDWLESNGVDLFLTFERLIADADLDLHIDLDRRQTQLEQLIS
jgi:hypothetical protein